MEKGNNFSFKIKLILTSIMMALVGLFISLNKCEVDAYNLPDYEVNENSGILNDCSYFGLNMKKYKASKNDSSGWEVFYIAENYTEREGYIINYFYLYSYNFDIIGAHDINLTLNDFTFNCCWDDYTRGQDEETGDTWLVREYLMTFCDKYYDVCYSDTEGLAIIKLRLDGNFLNLDETRTYNISRVHYLYYTNNYNNVDRSYIDCNYSITYQSVYTSDDDTPVDIPYYVTVKTFDTDPGEIYFKFTNCALNSNISQIRINGIDYALNLHSYDPDGWAYFKTKGFNLTAKGTMTYNINGYYVGSKYYDISDDKAIFRFVKEKSVIQVEAEKKVVYSWSPIGGNLCCAYFNLKEKENGNIIENATRVICKYTYKGNKYKPDKIPSNASVVTGAISGVWKAMWDGSNRDGFLYNVSQSDEASWDYGWFFGIKITEFDVLLIEYEVENEIITGSCYPDGLYIENDIVYDMNGYNRSDEYGVGDDGLIYEKDADGNIDYDNEVKTENPDTVYVNIWDDFWNKFNEKLESVGKKISIIASLVFVFIGLYVVLAIINKFKKKE